MKNNMATDVTLEQPIFNPKNIELVTYFPFGKQIILKLNSVSKNFLNSNVEFVSSENTLEFFCMVVNEYYDLLFNLLDIKINSKTIKMIREYNNSLPINSKKQIVTKVKDFTKSFSKTYSYFRNDTYLNKLVNIHIAALQASVIGGVKDIRQKEKNKNRARLKSDSERLNHYKEAVELNKKGESVYKSSRTIAQKYGYDPQSFYSALKGWAKTNRILLIKHR